MTRNGSYRYRCATALFGLLDARTLELAVAASYFAEGRTTAPETDVRDFMYDIMLSLARGGAGIADDVCASAALYLAEVEVPKPKRWRKDGLATGIKPTPKTVLMPIKINGAEYRLALTTRTAVGVLKEG